MKHGTRFLSELDRHKKARKRVFATPVSRSQFVARGKSRRLCSKRCLAIAMVCVWAFAWLPLDCHGQSTGNYEFRWGIPAVRQTVDFSPTNPKRSVVFTSRGMAYEIPLGFYLVKHRRIALEGDAPEPGEFEVIIDNPNAAAEVRNARVENGKCRAEIVSKLAETTPSTIQAAAAKAVKDLRDLARKTADDEASSKPQAALSDYLKSMNESVPGNPKFLKQDYIRTRTDQLIKETAMAKLQEIAQHRPAWFKPAQKEAWPNRDEGQLLAEYETYFVFQTIDTFFEEWGFEIDSQVTNFQNLFRAKLNGFAAATSGQTIYQPEEEDSGKTAPKKKNKPNRKPTETPDEDPARKVQNDALKAVAALNANDLKRLHELLGIPLLCRFYPATDPRDANSQWFNGQRVSCRGAGVTSIRIEGKLDPAAGDKVDWWILEGFDPAKVRLSNSESASCRVDPPFVSRDGVRLRVVATGNRADDYWIEFRPAAEINGLKVRIHESPSSANRQFPF